LGYAIQLGRLQPIEERLEIELALTAERLRSYAPRNDLRQEGGSMRLFLAAALLVLILAPSAGAVEYVTGSFIEYGTDYRLETTVTMDSGSLTDAGCRTVTVKFVKTNGGPGPLSNDLYKIFQRRGWCWNAAHTKVTSTYNYARWKECCDPGWQWVAWEPTISTGTAGANYTLTRRIEGHTKFCGPVIGCVDHDYPWIKLYINGNGSYGVLKGAG
jgi:hypothetical protein